MNARFGEQRLVRPDVGIAARLLFRGMGVADAPHYLHYRLLKRHLDSLGALAPRQILDAGCGAGDYSFYLARRFPDAQILGVDIDQALIERNISTARLLGLSNVRFENADLSAIQFSAEFDLIVSIDVLEHIPRQQDALSNLVDALSGRGRVFFHIPTVRERPVPFSKWLNAFHKWAEAEHVADELTAEEFRARVEEAGLEISSVERTFGYYAGELATSLTALPYADSPRNRVFQALLAPICRALVLADHLHVPQTRYAVAITGGSRRMVSSCAARLDGARRETGATA